MKIGIDISVLSDNRRTGIAVYSFELIKALLKINKEDKIILFGITPFATYSYIKNLEFKDYPNVEMKIFRMPSKVFRRVFLLWQKLNIPSIEYFIGEVDIFHSFNWFLPPQKKGKVIATVFDLTSVNNPQWHHPRTTQLDKIRFERIKNNADLVIAISKNSEKDYLRFDPKKKVEVIYPAVSEKFAKNLTNVNNVLKKYGLRKGYFLSVATLEPRKNIKNLIKAYLKTGLPKPLVLVGISGWKNEEVVQLIGKNKERIIFTDYIPDEDLPYIYKGALAFVYPSFYEGFGIPVLEAMSLGVPVITSKNSSLPEVGGNAALYIDPYNTENITEALVKITTDARIRKELSRKGLMQAKKFSWEKSAKEMIKLYKSFT